MYVQPYTPHTNQRGTDLSITPGLLTKSATPLMSAGPSFIVPAAACTTALSIVSKKGVTQPEAIIAETTPMPKSTDTGTF